MIDGTKIKANASMDQNRSYSGVVREVLREAEEADRREDELYGDARGDELPEQLRTAEGRRAALGDAKRWGPGYSRRGARRPNAGRIPDSFAMSVDPRVPMARNPSASGPQPPGPTPP